jgi:hypothetical protein
MIPAEDRADSVIYPRSVLPEAAAITAVQAGAQSLRRRRS